MSCSVCSVHTNYTLYLKCKRQEAVRSKKRNLMCCGFISMSEFSAEFKVLHTLMESNTADQQVKQRDATF